jgi:hypothetical protein
LFEVFEDLVDGRVRNPGSVVGYDKDVLLAVGEPFHEDLISPVLASVLQEVADHLLDPLGVSLKANAGRQRHRSLPDSPGGEQHVGYLVDQGAEVEGLDPEPETTGLETRDDEDILDEIL